MNDGILFLFNMLGNTLAATQNEITALRARVAELEEQNRALSEGMAATPAP